MRDRLFILAMFLVTLAFGGCSLAQSSTRPIRIEELSAAGSLPTHAESSEHRLTTPLRGANGLAFDDRGRLFVASFLGQEILVMDPRNGRIIERLRAPERQMGSPDDLVFGPNRSLYWTSVLTGEVKRLSSDGILTSQLIGPAVNSIAFSDSGRLFVGQCLGGAALYEVDPMLSKPARLIREDLGPGCSLNGMAWHDGYLYGPRWFAGQVIRVNVDSGSFDVVADGFVTPAAVKFDSRGRLYVLDGGMGEVVRVDIATGAKELVAQLPPGQDNLAFDAQGRLFVSSYVYGSIAEVLGERRIRYIYTGGMVRPGGVAVVANASGSDHVFVADVLSLREFDARTRKAEKVDITRFGSLVGRPDPALPLTVAAEGNDLILSSWRFNVVQVFNLKNRRITEEHFDFAMPGNAIRHRGSLIVCELKTGSVVKLDFHTGERTTIATGLQVPTGLAANDTEVWVADWATGTVWNIVHDGEARSPVAVATDLKGPEGLTADGNGALLVVESGAKRLSRIDLASREVSTVAEDLPIEVEALPGEPHFGTFNGVAVSTTGTIYLTGDRTNALYRLRGSH